VVETQKAAILAALQITDELFGEQTARRELDDEIRALSADVSRWIPPAKRPSDTADHPALG
jgi:cell division protein ZapA